jgi:hypothetical protein
VDPEKIKLGKGTGGGPLGQELMYVFGHVLWSRAALGLGLPTSLPLAVVAALRRAKEPDQEAKMAPKAGPVSSVAKEPVGVRAEPLRFARAAAARADGTGEVGGKPPRPSSVPKEKTRWVYGRLLVPEERGGRYTYQVRSCGGFHDTAAESALAAYMDVIVDGLSAGEKWIDGMRDAERESPTEDALPWPTPVSGLRLYFGWGSLLNLDDEKLVATPVRMREVGLQSSQGELYAGRVSLAKVREVSQSKIGVRWCQSASKTVTKSHSLGDEKIPAKEKSEVADGIELAEAAMQSVLVKVTSKACHAMLVQEDNAFLWNLSKFPPDLVSNVLGLISGSLHAIYLWRIGLAKYGLIQLMPDLRSEGYGYRSLRPRELVENGHLEGMCQAFVRLIEGTLVPLALQNVVHTDIRSSYSHTFNLLFCAKSRTMRLIDLDSLMHVDDLAKLPKDRRIVSPGNGAFSRSISSAFEFVCLQAICVATSWLKGKDLARKVDELGATADPAVVSELEAETAADLDTEAIIRSYVKNHLRREHVENGEAGGVARIKYFEEGRSNPVSFVLSQVSPLLHQLSP